MSKNKKEVAVHSDETFEAALKSEPVAKVEHNFTIPTLGIFKNKEGGYKVVKLLVDPDTLIAGPAEVLGVVDSKWEANEMFKINVVRQGIL